MTTLTTKLMSATLGLALTLGAAAAMTAASSIVTADAASARTLNGSRMNRDLGRKIERPKLELGKLKEIKPVKRELAREGLVGNGGKGDLARRIGEKQAKGRRI